MTSVARIGLLLIPLVLVAWLYTRSTAGDRRLRGGLQPAPGPARSAGPAVGTRLSVPGLSRLAADPGSKGWLLLRVGVCSGCLAEEVAAWERSAERRGYSLVVLSAVQDATSQQLRVTAQLRGAIVTDPSGAAGRWLGDSFTPRAFLFDPEWKLLALQKHPFPDAVDPMKDPGFGSPAR